MTALSLHTLEHDGLPSTNINSIREDAEGKLWINTIARHSVLCRRQAASLTPLTTGKRSASSSCSHGTEACGSAPAWTWSRFGPMAPLRLLVAASWCVRLATEVSGSLITISIAWCAITRGYSPTYRFHGWRAAMDGRGSRQRDHPRQGVLAMATDTDGEVVLLTPAGLVRAVDGRLSPPEVLPIPANIGDLPKVLSLVVDREGNRWVGTLGRGLLRFRRAPVTAYGKDEGLSDLPFRAVFQDREGRIWLGGDSLYWFDGRQFHLFRPRGHWHAIAQTNDGDLWFGGTGGLYRWRSGVLTRFRVEAPSVDQIRQDRQGTLWIIEQTYVPPGRALPLSRGADSSGSSRRVPHRRGPGRWLWVATGIPGLRYLHGGKTRPVRRGARSAP